MFAETGYNLKRYFNETDDNSSCYSKETKLPFILTSVGSPRDGYQTPVERPQGFFSHHCLWVTKGEGIFEIGGQTMLLHEGEGLFCRRDVPHSYRDSGNGFATAWFTYLGAESLFDYYGVGDWFRFSVPPLLTETTVKLVNFCRYDSDVVSRSSAGYSLLTDFFHSCFAEKATLGQKTDRYLETHFDRNITLDDIAAAVGYSKFSLCRKYSEEQGKTVMEQLKKIRVAKAKRYLMFSDLSVNEVGKMCGFSSPSYFGKTFKEETGISPFKYRNTVSKK